MKGLTRLGLDGAAAASAVVLAAGPSLAMDCVKASKLQSAGIQVLLGPSGIEWSTNGVATRIAQATGEQLLDAASGGDAESAGKTLGVRNIDGLLREVEKLLE